MAIHRITVNGNPEEPQRMRKKLPSRKVRPFPPSRNRKRRKKRRSSQRLPPKTKSDFLFIPFSLKGESITVKEEKDVLL